MNRYVLGRLAMLPFSILVVSIMTFSFLHLVPGDAVDALGGETLSAKDLAQLRTEYGLDRSIPEQYFRWLGHALQGDLGTSIRTRRPVTEEVMGRVGMTLQLAVFAIIMSVAIGIVAGAIATAFRYRFLDRFVMGLSTIGMSVPNYFAATLLILFISLYFPSAGVVSYVPPGQGVLASFASLFFPALALAVLGGSTFARYVRGSAEDIIRGADFIRTARSKGASQRRILMLHTMPNTLIPLTTAAGLQFAYLMGGTVVIESIFALPGLGQLMLAAIAQRDYPVVQGCVLLQASVFVLINLIVDLSYPLIDPRVRSYGAGK
jgi:peptide/nickel transport system permease protein